MKKKIACLVVLLMAMFSLQVSDGVYAKPADDLGTVKVKGYTKANGTQVKEYTWKKKTKPSVQKVSGYTRKDGTVVKGYTRKKSSKSK